MRTNDTRLRIVEAMVELHQEIGPVATTVTAIAERAGVQRLTVYRHFPDDRAMLGACSSHWLEAHPLPDPGAWTGISDPRIRLETALEFLYGWFRNGAPMLSSIATSTPAASASRRRDSISSRVSGVTVADFVLAGVPRRINSNQIR